MHRLELHRWHLAVFVALAGAMGGHARAQQLPTAAAPQLAVATPSQGVTDSIQASNDGSALESITVLGQGEVRQVSSISKTDLDEAAPGSNPIRVLEKLPGVHFVSSDPFGTNEWSSRLSVRGFSQTYLGYTLDGIPLGDYSYAAHNGLSIGRAIIAEDLDHTTLSQGAGALGTPSTSNLGGTVQFFSGSPDDKFGVRAAQTVGSNDTFRSYARIDSGAIAQDTKAYFSVLHQTTDKWKGAGAQRLNQENLKLVTNKSGYRLSLFYDHSDRRETDYQELSLEMVGRLGWNWDNYYPNWQEAVNAANGIYAGAVNNFNDAYWVSTTLRTDTLAGATLDLDLGPSAGLQTTVYDQYSRAEGDWWGLQSPSPSGVPFSALARTYHIRRQGITSNLTWSIGAQEIKAGVWLEHNDHNWAQILFDAGSRGDGLEYQYNPYYVTDEQNFVVKTHQFYLQDTIALLGDRAKVIAGFKSPSVGITSDTLIGSGAAGNITASKAFLPQVGLNFKLTSADELFASYSQNQKAFTAGPWGPFMVTQPVFDATSGSLKPETSSTWELGYRFRRDQLQGSLAAYSTQFNNRLVVISNCILLQSVGSSCPEQLANVGKVQSRGLEAAVIWNPVANWKWLNTAAYNNSVYESDWQDNGGTVAANGNQVVDSPRLILNTELSYEAPQWFASINGRYTAKRYYTYTNDNYVPGFAVWNLAAGYKLADHAGLHDLKIQLNVTNIFDRRYFGTLGTNGFPASDPTGTFPTAEAAPPVQAFLTVSGKF